MKLPLEKRFGIFLIAVSIWYLINLKIFNALQPILAIPGSVTILVGLWLLLSPLTPTASTKTITRTTAPPQAPAPTTMKLETMPTSKLATKTKLKISKKTKTKPRTVKKPVRKSVRKKKKTSKSSA